MLGGVGGANEEDGEGRVQLVRRAVQRAVELRADRVSTEVGWGGAESADPGGLTLQPSRMGIWTWEKDRPRSGLKTAASSSPDMVPLGSNAPQ